MTDLDNALKLKVDIFFKLVDEVWEAHKFGDA